MASISRDAGGKIRVMFTDAAKKRRAVYLGNVNKKHAETIKMRVETLAASVASNRSVTPVAVLAIPSRTSSTIRFSTTDRPAR